MPLATPVEALAQELLGTQRDAARPARFEQAVARAFAFLGFDVTPYGQAGHTDVLVDSRLGHERFRAVVDAKANSGGKVPEGQINWPAIQGHQRQVGADHAVVVGERFAGGNLHKFAADFGVALVDTAALVEVVRLHARTPFPAADLQPLFATAGSVSAVVADLRQKSEAIGRHWQLAAEIVRLVNDFSRLVVPLMPTTGSMHAALVSKALASGGEQLTPPSEQEVRDAVTFLSCRAMGILRSVDPDTGGYRLAMSVHTALQRLHAMEGTIHGLLAAAPRAAAASQTSGGTA